MFRFGKKSSAEDSTLPEMNVAAGVSRALKPTSSAGAKPTADAARADVRDALAAIEAALTVIDQVREIVEEALDLVDTVANVDDAGGRALLAERYDDMRQSIDAALEDADERAAPLIGRTQRQIDVRLADHAHYSVSPTRLAPSPDGLALEPPRDAFDEDDEVGAARTALSRALDILDGAAALYCRDAQYLIARAPLGTTEDAA
ncbi:MAG: hypothetical protein ACFB00_01305 [Parvularculaceae bacterium]